MTESTLSQDLATPVSDQFKDPAAAAAREAVDGIEETVGEYLVDDPKISTRNVDVFYGDKQAIFKQ